MAVEGAAPGGGRYSRAAAYAAAVWALLFAAMSFYWALGGRAGLSTQAVSIRNQVDDPTFVVVLWVTGILKVLAALIAVVFILPLGRRIPQRLLLVTGWLAAGFLLLYGSFGWIQALLWETGVHDIPSSVGAKASRWKLIFWDPFWLLGGCLFLLAVWQFQGRRPTSAT